MSQEIIIIGAGVSGLTAALHLESLGYSPKIYEASDSVGGRVKSDVLNDYILDHGFQVLLTAYPMAQKYLDFESLNLNYFKSGSYVFKKGQKYLLGDPLRDFGFLIPTITSKVGTISDKLKVFKLSKLVKKKSIETIFNEKEKTTLEYLKDFGFSNLIIDDFFKPFFGGIFLETALATSSRKFEFVFKMFSEGHAAIPEKGMQAIPEQLFSKLKNTQINFNTPIQSILGNQLTFKDGSSQTSDYIIVATDATNGLITNLSNQPVSWKSTQTLYFEVALKAYEDRLIALSASSDDSIINSICFPGTQNNEAKNHLLSVSVVKGHKHTEYELIQAVRADLKSKFDIDTISFLKSFDIKKALPVIDNIQYAIHPSETQLTEYVFLAGDTVLNGSLNAAMLSGELAAEAIHEKVTGNLFS